MYDSKEYYTVIAPDDRLNIRRYSASVTHELFLSSKAMLKTTAYGYTTSRNWLRQDFSRTLPSDFTGVVHGDTTIPGGAIYMRNSTGNRNRQFEVLGLEPRFFTTTNIFNLKNEIEGGGRLLYERAYEQRVNGNKAGTLSGDLREDEIRTGYAGSLFILSRIFITDKFILSPGVRGESFDYSRDIYRISGRDTLITEDSNLLALVPGIGLNYNLEEVSFFAGVHRGFAPPRIKDAINNSGVDLQLDAELSWNYEIGLRSRLFDRMNIETAVFLLDFSNQVIPVSQSSGGTGTGLVNGGRTLHRGVEASLLFEVLQKQYSDVQLNLGASATFSRARYNSERYVVRNNQSINVNGNTLPYAPKILISGTVDFIYKNFSLLLNGQYTGEQYTDELNTETAPATGLQGLMPSFLILNSTARYYLEEINSSFFLSVKNLLDERYIASRRPEGIRAGLPRMVMGGLELIF